MGDTKQLPWLYFGCGPHDSGHYLFNESGQKAHYYGTNPHAWLQAMCWDCCLAPQPENVLYAAALSRLGGWGYSALSWWDRSMDKCGRSNSTILAPDMSIDPAVMLDEATRRFPWVFSRLPHPIKLLEPR